MTHGAPDRSILLIALSLLALGACTSSRPFIDEQPDAAGAVRPPDAERTYQLFLIGDTGAEPGASEALRMLGDQARATATPSAVVFLGGLVYPCGLPDSTEQGYAEVQQQIAATAQALSGYDGRVVVVPGERDWRCGGPDGEAAVLRLQRAVTAHFDEARMLPADGFPGPTDLKLTDDLVLIALDTPWWLHAYEKPFGDTGEYDLDEEADALLQLEDVIERHRDERIVVVGHHPIVSNGRHGGHFPLRAHLFPLTDALPGAYLPLPLVGSAYPLYRSLVGQEQDLAHQRYRTWRTAAQRVLRQHRGLVYAAAHDQSLQYHKIEHLHHVVSGSGGAGRYVARGRGATFTYAGTGFARIDIYADGTLWLAMLDAEGRLLFEQQLEAPIPEQIDAEVPTDLAATDLPDYRDSTVVVQASPDYLAGPLVRLLSGKYYRKAWAAPVEVPVFDIGREKGGLTPIKRGGSAQTVSLRLRDADGHEYVLRSTAKHFKSLSRFGNTFAADVAQDQMSSLHPYGAYLIPALSDAAGLYHTNPKAVYVPHDPRFGIYQDLVGGRLMLFEERPDEGWPEQPSFGRSDDIVSSRKLYEEMEADNDHRVDQHTFLRARLFDWWVADWDRHPDQWRWATFEPPDSVGKIYVPIPRDRDWAFFRFDGPLPALSKWALPEYQDFGSRFGYLRGAKPSTLAQDRRLTSELDGAAWRAITDSLQHALTDEVIEDAVRQWPDTLVALDGDRLIRLLKHRRDRLPELAEEWYGLLARVVDVVGSDKHERFEVTRLPDGQTRVQMWKTSKEGEVRMRLYDRTFHQDETKEIRLYGLDGQDQFIIRGEAPRAIRVRAVGGPGDDRFEDTSRVGGLGRSVHLYDNEHDNTFEPGPETHITRSDLPAANRYDKGDFKYPREMPLLFFGSNKDDGVFIGGGIHWTRHGFRKAPYASSQKLRANVAARTAAFNARYSGHFVGVLGALDLQLSAEALSPNNIRNFYGLGNETEDDAGDAEFYQARLARFGLAPALYRALEGGFALRLGPTFEYIDVGRDTSAFVRQPQAGISARTFDNQIFAGAEVTLQIDRRDRSHHPLQGFRFTTLADLNVGVLGLSNTYTRLATDLRLYASPVFSPQLTFALRLGGAHNVGDFPFYDANTLGGKDNLRGYRSTRFAGRSSVYQNLDVRLELFRFSNYLALGRAGVLGFVDGGRVWADGEHSRTWHAGYGGGLWVDLFDQALVHATLGFSDEDRAFAFGLGFQY